MNPFLTHRFSCSSIGHLLTGLTIITDKQNARLIELEARRNGNGKPLTPNMEIELADLKAKKLKSEAEKKGEGKLPDGVITELKSIYRSVVWKRKEPFDSLILQKGLHCEQDGLDLVSRLDDEFYVKNTTLFINHIIQGTPDVHIKSKKIIDIKASWDMKTFDNAELISLYRDQVRGYMWLTDSQEGEVCYCLVNAPVFIVVKERSKLWYLLGEPSFESDKWIEAASQLERNMIFDLSKFNEEIDTIKKDNPAFKFEFVSKDLDFDVPESFRVKRFAVELSDQDIRAFDTRLPVCRQYLINRYNEEMNSIQD